MIKTNCKFSSSRGQEVWCIKYRKKVERPFICQQCPGYEGPFKYDNALRAEDILPSPKTVPTLTVPACPLCDSALIRVVSHTKRHSEVICHRCKTTTHLRIETLDRSEYPSLETIYDLANEVEEILKKNVVIWGEIYKVEIENRIKKIIRELEKK